MTGRPPKPYKEDQAKIVKSMSMYGVPQEQIASVVGMSVETMNKLYRQQILEGMAAANGQIGQRLFQKAMEGDTSCLIFWAKTRMNFKENQAEMDPRKFNPIQIFIKDDLPDDE